MKITGPTLADLDRLSEAYSASVVGAVHDVCARAALHPDLGAVNGIRTWWAELVEQDLLPQLATAYWHAADEVMRSAARGLTAAVAPGALADPGVPDDLSDVQLQRVANARAEQHLADAGNRLVRVGDDVWSEVRGQLLLGTQAGEGVAKLAARIDGLPPIIAAREEVVARTEVNDVANAGAIDQVRAFGIPGRKTWNAAEDSRTRPTHADADGQTVALDEHFTVGGYQMDRPHDHAAGPEETINCRCTMGFELADDDLTGASDDYSAARDAERYTPDALRDVSDDELGGLLTAAGDDDTRLMAVLSELDRRDTLAKAAASKQRAQAERDAALDAEYDKALARGDDPETAYERVYGVTVERQRRDTAMAALRAQGFTGRSFDELARAAYREEIDRMYLVAEHDTRGVLLNPAGLGGSIDPRRLFTGTEAMARKYASDELLTFWQQHGRLTFADYKAGLLGTGVRIQPEYWI